MSNSLTKQIGQTIRELRKAKGITGEEFGRRVGLSQSKISKIETGYYTQLQYEEIENILNILEAPSPILQQTLRSLRDKTANGYSIVTYSRSISLEYTTLEHSARLIKVYTANAIPALLQTVVYRRGSLTYKGIADEAMGGYIQNALSRQDLFFDGKHSFHLVIPQSVLYTLATSKKEHVAQLDRLERIANVGDESVKLGIIPLEAGTVLAEYSSFALYDDRILVQALANSELTTKDKREVDLHVSIFNALESIACYRQDAIQLIRKAADYFL